MRTLARPLAALWILLAVLSPSPAGPSDLITLSVVYDNNPGVEGFESHWGFSCLIRGTEKTILFDTGQRWEIFLRNLSRLGVSPSDIDLVVISHEHGDHTGGLIPFLQGKDGTPVFLPESFPRAGVRKIVETGTEVRLVRQPREICRNVIVTGEIADVAEQALVLGTPEGAVIITGCAHPGIVNIVKRAREITDGRILLAIGGFHLFAHPDREVRAIIRELKALGLERAGPCHCTGARAIELFREEFGRDFVPVGVGTVLEIGKAGKESHE